MNKKSSKRALRRHHAERKYKGAVRKYADWQMADEMGMPNWLRRNFNHLTACSCWMCGHQRKWHGLAMQEKRSMMALEDEN